MVHSRAGLAHIREANAELQQARKFMRFISARRDADLVDRAPKAIAGGARSNGLRRRIAGPQRCRRRPGVDDPEVGRTVFPIGARRFRQAEKCRRLIAELSGSLLNRC
jgi:hypothetical protein